MLSLHGLLYSNCCQSLMLNHFLLWTNSTWNEFSFYIASCIPAHALTPVRDYKGPCTLVLSKRSIGVSTDNENLGTWPFECIRRFHSQDLNYFSFTSGRRGPYGVCDYTFKIKDEDLKKLQDILSQCTGKYHSFYLIRIS